MATIRTIGDPVTRRASALAGRSLGKSCAMEAFIKLLMDPTCIRRPASPLRCAHQLKIRFREEEVQCVSRNRAALHSTPADSAFRCCSRAHLPSRPHDDSGGSQSLGYDDRPRRKRTAARQRNGENRKAGLDTPMCRVPWCGRKISVAISAPWALGRQGAHARERSQ